jgi:hypothetical protein
MELVNGLGGSAGFGENALIRNDDGSSAFIDLSTVFGNGLNFFGSTYNGLYINNNGSVTFTVPLSAYTPTTISSGTVAGIFPLWTDVDTRGGAVTPSVGGTSQGTNLVHYDLDSASGKFTVTWDDVGYYASHTNLVNAFQLVIEDLSDAPGRTDGDFSFRFIYETINWTTGDASNGVGGLGGIVAHGGYSAGNGSPTFFEIPESGIEAQILALDEGEGYSFVSTTSEVVENLPPELLEDTASVNEDTAIVVNVLVNDSDPEGDALTLISGVDAHGGVVTVTADNQLSITQAANFFGDTNVTYTVSDGQGNTSFSVLTLTVNPVNDAPVANADSVTTVEGVAVPINALANDVDIENDALTLHTHTSAAHGIVASNDTSFTYTPDAGFVGVDSFTYSVTDGFEQSNTVTVNDCCNRWWRRSRNTGGR